MNIDQRNTVTIFIFRFYCVSVSLRRLSVTLSGKATVFTCHIVHTLAITTHQESSTAQIDTL